MKKGIGCVVALGVFIGLLVIAGAFYTVPETEQVIITQFGEPIGEPITTAGLKFKIPFIQDVNRIEKRILEWDGRTEEMPTKDKTYIRVDTYARWQIKEPLLYFQALRDERSALSRLDDILGSETRNTVAKHDLIEVIRTTKDREPAQAEELLPDGQSSEVSEILAKVVVTKFTPIRLGRAALEQEIFAKSKEKLKAFGIDLLDVRFKRINYNPSVQDQIFERMISERQQIAEKFRSEGAGKAAIKLGEMERDLKEIQLDGLQASGNHQGRSRRQSHRDLCQRLQQERGDGGILRIPQDDGPLQGDHRPGQHPDPFHGQRRVPVSEAERS